MKSTREMIEVMEAFERGEEIEHRRKGLFPWSPVEEPFWNWSVFDYRIKRRAGNAPDTRRICDSWRCGWKGELADVLVAEDPFNKDCFLQACPRCRDQTIRTCCDEPGCWEPDTCGTHAASGYRRTCGKHVPKK